MNEVSLRIGIVVGKQENSVRVNFPDTGIVSDWLSFVKSSDDDFMPDFGDTVVCLYGAGFNADGFVLGVI